MADDIYEYYFKDMAFESHKEPHYVTQRYIKYLEGELELYRDALKKIDEAVVDKGSNPKYHDVVMKNHRLEWATLWIALDRARALLYREEERKKKKPHD